MTTPHTAPRQASRNASTDVSAQDRPRPYTAARNLGGWRATSVGVTTETVGKNGTATAYEQRTFLRQQLVAASHGQLLTVLARHAADDEAWQEQALCRETDPEVFFPDKGGRNAEAIRVCRACPVRPQCLKWALDHDERFGIWGGTSQRERRRLKRRTSSDHHRGAMP